MVELDMYDHSGQSHLQDTYHTSIPPFHFLDNCHTNQQYLYDRDIDDRNGHSHLTNTFLSFYQVIQFYRSLSALHLNYCETYMYNTHFDHIPHICVHNGSPSLSSSDSSMGIWDTYTTCP